MFQRPQHCIAAKYLKDQFTQITLTMPVMASRPADLVLVTFHNKKH